MEKILTISIAAYNVEKYIEKTLKSLIIKNINKLEILVQDDGSKDKTSIIAKKYEKLYPNSIKVIKKENGGYGSTINNSIKIATGKYFKQLDGDDWYNINNLELLIDKLEKIDVDIVYTPYYKYFEKNKELKLIDRFFEIKEGEYKLEEIIKKIYSKKNKSFMMPSLIFKTQILQKNNIKCQEKCFYTDTEFVIYPFIYAETIYISKLSLYYYRIGREGQSISLENRKKYFNDHLKVSTLLLNAISNIENKKTQKYFYLLECICGHIAYTITNFLLVLPISKKNLDKIKRLDLEIKINNFMVYKKIEKISKTIFLLRKSLYLLYPILHLRMINKIKKELNYE